MIKRFTRDSFISIGLAAILIMSPLPLASNRPVFSMFWAMMIFGMATAYVAWPKSCFEKPLLSRRLFYTLSFLAFLLFGGLALHAFGIGSVAQRASLLAFFRMLSYGIFFWLIFQTSISDAKRKRFLKVIFCAVSLQAAIAMFVHAGLIALPAPFFTEQYSDSATGTFINRNALATYLGMGLLIGLAYLRGSVTPRPQKPFIWVETLTPINALILTAGITIFTALLMTQSRMGLTATILGLLVLVPFKKPTSLRNTLPIALIAVFAIVMLFLYGPSLVERSQTLGADISVRLELYRQTLSMIADKPFLGHGADSFAVAFPRFHAPTLDPTLVWDKPHNSYLTNWAELGLIFGSIPVLLVLVIATNIIRRVFINQTISTIAAACLAIIVQNMVHSSVDFSLEIPANTFVFIAVLGLGLRESVENNSLKKSLAF